MDSCSKRPRPPSQGRRKIEIKRIEKQSSRQVTFSKRRLGLFKKASEICIVTGAHAAVIIYNGKNVFSFGHPTPDAVINRYLTAASGGAAASGHNFPMAAELVPNIGEYNKHYLETSEEVKLEKGKDVSGGGAAGKWWLDDVDGKGVEELEVYVAALEELCSKVTRKADDFMVINSSNSFTPPLPAAVVAASPPQTFEDALSEFVDGFINTEVGGYEYKGHV